MVRTQLLLGREAELARIQQLFQVGPPKCLLLTGEPGIGKTTLWDAGIDTARRNGYQVLAARASEAESLLSFSALSDLMASVIDADLESLPPPQRRALEVALRRAEPEGAPPDQLAVAAGFLGILKAMAERSRVLVAIDDLQWLDRSSLDVLLSAAHRVSGVSVDFLMAQRAGAPRPFDRALRASGIDEISVAGLSMGAIGHILAHHLSLTLSRRLLRQLHEGAQGNPLIALELGRLLSDGRLPIVGGRLIFPEIPHDLFTTRIQTLPASTRRILLTVALSGGLSTNDLASFADPLDLADAVEAGVVAVDGTDVRVGHPMLAAAIRRDATADERRATHKLLAAGESDPIRRSLHLAIVAEAFDPGVARLASQAADLATSRGQVWDAITLAEHALRLTAPHAAEHGERLLRLARAFEAAGDIKSMATLLMPALDALEPGTDRAIAHLLLCGAWNLNLDDRAAHISQALAEAGDDPEIRAWALVKSAGQALTSLVGISEAHRDACEAAAHAGNAAEHIKQNAAVVVMWTTLLLGRSVDEVSDLVLGTSVIGSSDRVRGVQFGFRGEIDQARHVFDRLATVADERGELDSIAGIKVQQCELELRAGRVATVDGILLECEAALRDAHLENPGERSFIARLHAVRAAVAGDPNDARRWTDLVELHSSHGVNPESPGWDRLEARRARGIADLFEGRSGQAAQFLGSVWDHTTREHIDDPGAFPVAGDLIEALLLENRIDDAEAVLRRLEALAEAQDHPWALATVVRCRALIDIDRRDDIDSSLESLLSAAQRFRSLGLDFDAGRTLLNAGVRQRRNRKRAAARTSLIDASAIFQASGATGWAERAHEELDRVSGRRAAADNQLTPTEAKVAQLAASGLSNVEIAARLVVSVNTVEGHLSHAYAKLGIRSRSQLASRLT